MFWPTSWPIFLSPYKWLRQGQNTHFSPLMSNYLENNKTLVCHFFSIVRGQVGLQNDIEWYGLIDWPLEICPSTIEFETLFLMFFIGIQLVSVEETGFLSKPTRYLEWPLKTEWTYVCSKLCCRHLFFPEQLCRGSWHWSAKKSISSRHPYIWFVLCSFSFE